MTMNDAEQQPVWNTVRPVIANIAAATAEEAERVLDAALQKAGFDLFDTTATNPISLETFRAEDGTEAWTPPAGEPPGLRVHRLPADYRHH